MIGILTESEIERVLAARIIGRIGCHHSGTTYVVPISYAYDSGSVYVISTEGMKLSIMRSSPEVCFEVDNHENMANWQSVITWGTFYELTEPESRRAALNKLLARILPLESSETTHLFDDWPFVPGDLNEIKGVVYEIRLHKKTGRFEKKSSALSASL